METVSEWILRQCKFSKQETFDFYKPKEYRPALTPQDLQTQEEQLEQKREEFEAKDPDEIVEWPFEEEYPQDYVFHGTTKEVLPSMFQIGLVPSVGKFFEEHYGDHGVDLEELLYMAKREDMEKALNAMIYQVGKQNGYDWPYAKVTPQDIIQHGALVLTEPVDAYQAQEDQTSVEMQTGEETETPLGAEPSDIWSRSSQHASSVITGPQLLQVLMEYGGSLINSLRAQNPKAWTKIKLASTSFGYGGMEEGFKIQDPSGATAIGYTSNADFPNYRSSPTRGELFFVTVPEEHRRKGIGLSLSIQAIQLMKSKGCKTVNMSPTSVGGSAIINALKQKGLISDPIRTSPTGKKEYQIL